MIISFGTVCIPTNS